MTKPTVLPKRLRLGDVRERLADLAAAGAMDAIAGLVVGRCYAYDRAEARATLETTVAELLHRWQFPILMHADVGHTNPMVTLPMGALARLDSQKDEFAVLEAGVE